MNTAKKLQDNLPFILIAIFAVTISILSIPCSDDFFFQAWEFSSLKDMFLLHPSNSLMYSFVPQNGRYLGNILGLFLSRTYGSISGIIVRTILVLIFLFILILLIAKICRLDRSKTLLVSLLVILSPIHFYTQIYHWSAGFANYFPPVLGFLCSVYFITNPPRTKKMQLLSFAVAFATQLFIEHVTAFAFCFISLCSFIHWYKHKTISRHLLLLWLASLLGAVAMLSYPGYYVSSGEKYNSIGFQNLFDTIRLLSLDVVIANGFVWSIAGIFLRKLEYRHLGLHKLSQVGYWLGTAYSLVRTVQVALGLASYRRLDVVAALLFVILLAVMILNLKPCHFRWYSILWYGCLLFINGMLLVLSPISARCAFISYILTILWLMELLHTTVPTLSEFPLYKPVVVVLTFASCIYSVRLTYHYYDNYVINEQMYEYAELQMNHGSSELYLPLLRYPQYAHDSNSLIYYLHRFFYQTQGDIYIELQPYETWYVERYLPTIQ